MHRHLAIISTPIDENALRRSAPTSTTAGAVVCFLGIVRNSEAGEPIRALHYEAFEAMAIHQFQRLFDEVARRWPVVESVRLVHRVGEVPAGDPSLWVELAAPHRGEAFAAAQWLIDEMKRVVPIWKQPRP